ncbi:MAG TPA: sugar-binding protein [Bryobacteraceae bacterium]|nr:sugar-binding protein [Bryobacteraceae bacterium]
MLLLLLLVAPLLLAQKPDPYNYPIRVPQLDRAPVIDGDLSEWKHKAFNDGLWDIARLAQSPWYDPKINRITDHGNEPAPEDDLAARYYIAWDSQYLYLGSEVKDNRNDVSDPAHEPKRWYYKDAICWFIEAPRTPQAKKFGAADNAFCFVIDTSKPTYGAWWRHGAPGKTYIEEPIPKNALQYSIRPQPQGNFTLEARIAMAPTLGVSSPDWRSPRIGDIYGLEIVHTDPDGGDYGGHFLIYGRGDDDATWSRMELVGPASPIERNSK